MGLRFICLSIAVAERREFEFLREKFLAKNNNKQSGRIEVDGRIAAAKNSPNDLCWKQTQFCGFYIEHQQQFHRWQDRGCDDLQTCIVDEGDVGMLRDASRAEKEIAGTIWFDSHEKRDVINW